MRVHRQVHRRPTTRELYMRLKDRGNLILAMEQKNASVRTLANWADCSPAMIGFLRKGDKTTCTPELANRIEKALGLPKGFLFEPRSAVPVPQVSTVNSDAGHAVA